MPTPDGYEIDFDRERVDLDVVWGFLSTEAYWGRWRQREIVAEQIEVSWRVVGVYRDGEMVGFGRAISDGLGLAYLGDVFVVPEHRGRGVGVALVDAMINDEAGSRMRWMLHTSDAHGLYERFGFAPPDGTALERSPTKPPGDAPRG